jgi:hypothetical protein
MHWAFAWIVVSQTLHSCREVSGRGVIQWTSTLLKERLQEAEKDAARGVPVRVLSQAGSMALLELASEATIEVMQQLVEERAGLLIERQNLIVEGRQQCHDHRYCPCKLLQRHCRLAEWQHGFARTRVGSHH